MGWENPGGCCRRKEKSRERAKNAVTHTKVSLGANCGGTDRQELQADNKALKKILREETAQQRGEGEDERPNSPARRRSIKS